MSQANKLEGQRAATARHGALGPKKPGLTRGSDGSHLKRPKTHLLLTADEPPRNTAKETVAVGPPTSNQRKAGQSRGNQRRQYQKSKKQPLLKAVRELQSELDGTKDALRELKNDDMTVGETPVAIRQAPPEQDEPLVFVLDHFQHWCGDDKCDRNRHLDPQPQPTATKTDLATLSTVATTSTGLRWADVKTEHYEPAFRLQETRWWNPWYKRTYDSSKLINRDHQGMSTKAVDDHRLNGKLFAYLLSNKQDDYKDRKLALQHVQALRRKFYDLNKLIPGQNLTVEQIKVDLLTVARVVDQCDSCFLLQETVILEKRGFFTALSSAFSSKSQMC